MWQGKSRMEGATLHIQFEGDSRAYDGNHPIIGQIKIQTDRAIPAYGIQLKLELVDMSKKVGRGPYGKRIVHQEKRRVWEKSEMVAVFPNNVCNIGESNVPFSF